MENGGGVFAPPDCVVAKGDTWIEAGDGWRVHEIGLPIAEVRERAKGFLAELGLTGFGEMSDRQVAKLTGLSKEQAAKARAREFNEPITPPNQRRAGPGAHRGRRKGGPPGYAGGAASGICWAAGTRARRCACSRCSTPSATPVLTTMALGDAPNDLSMLEAVTHPVLVARPDGSHAALELEGLTREPLPGPGGLQPGRCWPPWAKGA